MTPSATSRETAPKVRPDRILHIYTLCAFAFSEPLFAALNQQFVYLHDLKAGWIEIAYVLFLLMAVVPVTWVLLDQLAIRTSSWIGGRTRNLVLGTLLCLVWLSLLRPFMKFELLESTSTTWMASLGIAIPTAILSSWLYDRSVWVRQWVSIAALSIVCFPGMFLYQYWEHSQISKVAPTVSIERPIPVVMVVFDEFSGTTLMNRNLQIDAQRFPQFARLAELSTWYRHASTVHTRTDVAIPAMLSGQYPATKRQPLEAEFPGNLFRLIHGTQSYQMTVFEPVTRLCPEGIWKRDLSPRTRTEKLRLLAYTLMSVYPRLVLPKDMPIDFPPISKLWFGLPEPTDMQPSIVSGGYHPHAFVNRDDQGQTFLRSQLPSDKPLFSFLHLEFPHVPWSFRDSGVVYNFDERDPFQPPGSWGDIGEDWSTDPANIARNEHRYLLQVQYVDRYIGQLLDRLQELEILEQCLLIVTADHGVSFRPGHSRRVPDEENLPDLLSVPLFIKLPGQKTPAISDRNVESIDILPTIAEVLGISLVEPVDGSSLMKEKARPRKTLYFEKGMTVLEPVIPRLQAAVERRWSIFDNGALDDPPPSSSTHFGWHGRNTSEFPIEDYPISSLEIGMPTRPQSDVNTDFSPSLVWGDLDPRDLRGPADLVLSVNGVIRDSGTTFLQKRNRGFAFLLPESVVAQRPCLLELFHVDQTTDKPRLLRLKRWELESPR